MLSWDVRVLTKRRKTCCGVAGFSSCKKEAWMEIESVGKTCISDCAVSESVESSVDR